MTSILFIYNSKAGKAKNLQLESLVKKQIPDTVQAAVIPIERMSELSQEHPADILVAVGGDGTVNAVAEQCLKLNKTLAVIPRGSGDGLARHQNIPYAFQEAIALILNGHTVSIDTVKLNGLFCLNVAGTGFEAQVAHKFGDGSKRGRTGYIKAIWNLYFGYTPQQAKLILDGKKTINESFFSLSIANGSQWGNNMHIASDASMRDGILELALMNKPKWHQLPALIAYLRSNKQQDSRLFTYLKAAHIQLHSSEGVWHIDGEPIKPGHKIDIQVVPNSLKMIVPNKE